MERGTIVDLLKSKDNTIFHLRQTLQNMSTGDFIGNNMQMCRLQMERKSREMTAQYQAALSEKDKKLYSLRQLLDNHQLNEQRTIRALEDRWKKEREGLETGRRHVVEWGLSTFKQKDDVILSLGLKVESLEKEAEATKERERKWVEERSEMESRARDVEVREIFRVKEKEKQINYLLQAMERSKRKQDKMAKAHTDLQNLCASQEKNWRAEREEMERQAREAEQRKMEERNEMATLQQTLESLQTQLDDMSKAHVDLQTLLAAQQEERRMDNNEKTREIDSLSEALYSSQLYSVQMEKSASCLRALSVRERKEMREMERRMNKAVEKCLTKEKEVETLEREREELRQLQKLKDCEDEKERQEMRDQLAMKAIELEKAEKKIHSRKGFMKFFKRQNRADIPDGKKVNGRNEREKKKKESC